MRGFALSEEAPSPQRSRFEGQPLRMLPEWRIDFVLSGPVMLHDSCISASVDVHLKANGPCRDVRRVIRVSRKEKGMWITSFCSLRHATHCKIANGWSDRLYMLFCTSLFAVCTGWDMFQVCWLMVLRFATKRWLFTS